jgi:glyoxylase-like metal-dependent hydrolase (beta-lactamase superfamily II)
MRRALLALTLCLSLTPASAADLVLKPVKVTEHVYAVIGDLGGQTYENDGLNNNLGFVVTDAGVLVVNTGPTERVARALHAAITGVTKQPIRWVVNVNSQNHYWHGNSYFAALGATSVAHQEANRLMQEFGAMQLDANLQTLKDKARDTRLAYPAKLFADKFDIMLGKMRIEVRHFGAGHTAGDAVVWLPDERVLFAGDLVYTQRLLAVIPLGNSSSWIDAFDKALALNPQHIIPGHGAPSSAAQARADTRDYLTYLRAEVKKAIDRGDSLDDAVAAIDQSRFKHLANYEQLARRNANQVYLEIEKE